MSLHRPGRIAEHCYRAVARYRQHERIRNTAVAGLHSVAWEIVRACLASDIGITGAIDRGAIALPHPAPAQVGGVHADRARRIDLGNECIL